MKTSSDLYSPASGFRRQSPLKHPLTKGLKAFPLYSNHLRLSIKSAFCFRLRQPVSYGLYPFLLLLFLILPRAQAQTFILGYGYGGHFYELNAVNQIIDRYNNAHLLDAEMAHFGYLDGGTFQLTMGKKWLFSYVFSAAGRKRTALYSAGGEQYRRALQFKVKSYKLGVGYLFELGEESALYFGLEGGADQLKLQGRAYRTDTRKPEWDVIEKSWHFSAGPSVMIILGKPFGLTINPYYNYAFTVADAESLDKGINGSAQLPPLNDYSVNLHRYGLRLLFCFQSF